MGEKSVNGLWGRCVLQTPTPLMETRAQTAGNGLKLLGVKLDNLVPLWTSGSRQIGISTKETQQEERHR